MTRVVAVILAASKVTGIGFKESLGRNLPFVHFHAP